MSKVDPFPKEHWIHKMGYEQEELEQAIKKSMEEAGLSFEEYIVHGDGQLTLFDLDPPHVHDWKEYVGLTKRDFYCECGEKRDTLEGKV